MENDFQKNLEKELVDILEEIAEVRKVLREIQEQFKQQPVPMNFQDQLPFQKWPHNLPTSYIQGKEN